MYRKVIFIFALLLAFGIGSVTPGQTVTGRISGIVTDASGAVLPGVAVEVVNDGTGLVRTVTTGPKGLYVVTNLPAGDYSVSVEYQGFKKAKQTGYYLIADGRLTIDFALEPGPVSVTIEITGTGETVNSTSGEIARVIDQAQVQELALNGRNYPQVITFIPGAPLLNDDPHGQMIGININQSINGSRGNTNLLTVDGGFNPDSGSNNSQNNNVGIDFIREVNIKTTNFSAEYGRNAGASINIVTRSGKNQFHGSAFEFLRNDKLDANNFFNNTRNPTVERPALRYNNFGFVFGGPIIKDKFHFFGGMEWKIVRRSTIPTLQTIPTRAERQGDFSARSNVFLKDPNKTGTCNATTQTACFPDPKVIPANLITPDGKAIGAVYNVMEKQAASYADTTTANNAVYQQLNPFDYRQDMLRLDYRFSEQHSINGRYLHDKYNLIDPFGTFITSPLPTIPTNRVRPGYGILVGHTWMISPQLINEAKANASWNGQRIPPVGELWKRETYGFVYPQLFLGGGRFENGIPDTTISGFASWDGPAGSLLSPTTDITVIDNLSWIHGVHTLKIGLLLIRNRKDQNGRTTYTGTVSFGTSGNPKSTSNAFADALLGNFRTYSEAANDPIGFFRFSQIESFVSDNWKVNRRLSMEIGLRYQYGWPTYTQANNIANFDPAFYNPAQALTVKPDGTIDTTKGGNRFNGLVRVGAGVPPNELGRVPNGNDPVVLSAPAGAPRGLYRPHHLFAPRFSFAFSPFDDNKTSVRSGFGIFYDRPEGNLIFSQLNLPPYSISAQFENGNLANIASAGASALAPFGNINAIDPNLVVPFQMNFSLSVQRELPWGIFGEAAYIGNLGRHLIRQPDINQPTFDTLVANAALPTAQRLSTNALRPYKGFSQILMRLSDSTSNYNALQLYATKRKGDLNFTVSYTWSKVLADTSSNSDNPEDPFNRSYNYGPTTFDRRHIFVTTYTYRLPFSPKSNALLYNTLSKWEVSGITRWQTGQYFTPTGNTSIGARRADYVSGVINKHGSDPILEWFNKQAFSSAPDTRRGTAGVGIIEGPGRYFWDLSLRKRFSLTEEVKLQFQADFFNAFNQTNFILNSSNGNNNPTTSLNNTNFGTITGAAPGRNVQLGLKLTF